MDMSLSKLQEIVKNKDACHLAFSRVAKKGNNLLTEQQQLQG